MVPECDVVVSFLVDTSGSMKTQRYEAVAVLLDTFARALDLAGVKSEVLGFTTKSWSGGKPMKQWRRDGMPDSPGRLSELQHIVYKDAQSTWRQARNSIAAMLRTDHYREGVDGEALLWAWERLLARPESRRYLVMISDGSPMLISIPAFSSLILYPVISPAPLVITIIGFWSHCLAISGTERVTPGKLLITANLQCFSIYTLF